VPPPSAPPSATTRPQRLLLQHLSPKLKLQSTAEPVC
jgi:hypothetical protein